MAEQSLSELCQELVEKNDKVLIHTQTCVLWKAEHGNCVGCESELGCVKLVALMLITVSGSGYSPKDFDDYLNMHKRITDLQDKILKAKTSAEVHELV